jgi:YHS domain-containing protein
MKSHTKQLSFLLSLAIVSLLTVSTLAQKKDSHHKHQHANETRVAKAGNFLGQGDGLETCPVTGDAIHSKDIKGAFFGRTVYFCCPSCLVKAKKSPAAYLKKTQEEQTAVMANVAKSEGHDHHGAAEKTAGNLAKTETHDDHGAAEQTQEAKKGEKQFLGKGDGIETCPVTGEPVNKDIKAEIKGRTIYACCPDCLDTVKNEPDLYLKQESGNKKEEKKEEKKDGKQDEKKEPTFLGKGDGVETCPVMGMPVDKDVKMEINGRTIYACCPGCLETIKENPDLYLKKTEKTDKKEKTEKSDKS